MSTLVQTGWAPPSAQYRRLIRFTGIAFVLGVLAYIGVQLSDFVRLLDDPNCERPSATAVVAPATDTHTFCFLDPLTGEERKAVFERGSAAVVIETGPNGELTVRTR